MSEHIAAIATSSMSLSENDSEVVVSSLESTATARVDTMFLFEQCVAAQIGYSDYQIVADQRVIAKSVKRQGMDHIDRHCRAREKALHVEM